MTSIKRRTEDEYMDPTGKVYQKPRYSILTYTWGRFRKDGEPALLVKGTEWAILPIDPEYFTVDAFQRLVECHLGSDNIEWAWIDVACINQTANSSENADEVGHQASIFDKAAAVFVWFRAIGYPGPAIKWVPQTDGGPFPQYCIGAGQLRIQIWWDLTQRHMGVRVGERGTSNQLQSTLSYPIQFFQADLIV
ncbi:hypothetical protein EJ04DRAFT_595250 [Polyplosphaeria fusca]|uniref:Heterokaryon incompatibility domain-containing protein n=1 Tax=Polyplosphaeria fusca TaxID=682080 RepID=A0A9P4QHH1_9PLEO|nr:hypothetical protein EJ04DRAFT_595250 [Polyplosphaeria fusca]